MKPLLPVELEIDYFPGLNHPMVKAFISGDVEISEIHINCIYDAIEYANRNLYDSDE